MHPLLIEALLEDIFSDLIKKFPTQEAQLKQAKNEGVLPKYLPWLARMLASGSEEPLEDIIPVIKAFHNKQPALKAKFPDEPSVIDINSYKSVADLSHKLESLVNIKYQSAPSDSDILYQDKKWLVAMPRTTAGSCELGKGTSWCTARTESQNLFLSYVASGENIFLFYVIDKEGNPRSDPDAKLSIGFVNGEPDFREEYGSMTVNAAQEGISKRNFGKIVGKDNADKFISLMTSKIKSYDGKHPAQEELDAIASDPILLKNKLNSFVNKEEQASFMFSIINNRFISTESKKMMVAARYSEEFNLMQAHSSTNSEVLLLLSQDENPNIRKAAIKNGYAPASALRELSDDIDSLVRYYIAKHFNSPPDVLQKLSDDTDVDVLVAVAENHNTPQNILLKLSNHINYNVSFAAKKNPRFLIPVNESKFLAYISTYFVI